MTHSITNWQCWHLGTQLRINLAKMRIFFVHNYRNRWTKHRTLLITCRSSYESASQLHVRSYVKSGSRSSPDRWPVASSTRGHYVELSGGESMQSIVARLQARCGGTVKDLRNICGTKWLRKTFHALSSYRCQMCYSSSSCYFHHEYFGVTYWYI